MIIIPFLNLRISRMLCKITKNFRNAKGFAHKLTFLVSSDYELMRCECFFLVALLIFEMFFLFLHPIKIKTS